MAFRADRRGRDLGPVGIGPEQVENIHPLLQAKELEHLHGFARLVELDIVSRAPGPGDRGCDVGGRLDGCVRDERSRGERERQCGNFSQAHVTPPFCTL